LEVWKWKFESQRLKFQREVSKWKVWEVKVEKLEVEVLKVEKVGG
jgi:hypothetical protein